MALRSRLRLKKANWGSKIVSMSMTKKNTNSHGTAFEGPAQADSTEEQQTLSPCNRAKYLEICNKSLQAITEALTALKLGPRS
jgi:hypothetical protein